MSAPLAGKIAVVTGAAGGIGVDICTRLSALGARLVLVDRREDALNTALAALPENSVGIAQDLTEPDAGTHIVKTVRERCGRCDLLVNNAGMVVTEAFEQAPLAPFEQEVTLNLLAPMRLIHALFPLLQESGGQVISVVSLGGQLPLKECPGYSASKFGLRGLMLALALREPLTGVRFSVINPAAVDTPMLRHEALNGGSALNFLDPPHPPSLIGQAVVDRALNPRVESDVPRGDGWLIRLVMAVPGLFTRVLPRLESRGEKGRQRYLRERGLNISE
ncbi:SDR family oxidoreductase [uncultured Abyssibacter sp.]|uniref:SDR family NAD(P)-dependent oxidoreductase n=1 Tax=uncultured Abyssibacter sp. TaxID=2320202 RepID=UPI0032B2A145